MSRNENVEIILVPISGLHHKYELVANRVNPEISQCMDFESHISLFLGLTLSPGKYGIEEIAQDYVNDLMMFDVSREDAEELLRRFLEVTKSLIERTTSIRAHHFEPDWKYLNYTKTTLVLKHTYRRPK